MQQLNPAVLLAVLAIGAGRAAQAQSSTGVSPSALTDLRFRLLGPSRGGRVTAVAGIAEQPLTFYMGATGGGVWKTADAGISWQNVSDGFFATPSIGAIDVADSDPNVVYVGTGSDGIRSNVITGKGVYKSVDAGRTWQSIGLVAVGQIGAVIVHPSDPRIVYVAAIGQAFGPNPDRGVYRTTDGGRSWTKVLFVSDSTGAADLEFAPDNPREIYATMWRGERKPWTIISGAREGGIYKSVDGGDTWVKLGGGLPAGLFGKADLAVSAADPNRVYALIEAPLGEGGVYRSDDRGATWRLMSTQASLLDRPFYYCNIDADPTNADRVFVSATGFFVSTNGGAKWDFKSVPHGDNHDLWINPKNPKIWIQSNDGGANVTQDDGMTWSTQLNQPTAELYQIAADDATPYFVYAGQQDNSTIAVPSLPIYSWSVDHPAAMWKQIGGCETGPAVPKPGDPSIVYSNCKGQFGRYDQKTGQEQVYWVGARDLYGHDPKEMRDRFQRVSPIHVSPHAPHAVYHASQYLYRTRDEGKTWDRISPDLTAHRPETQVLSGGPLTRDITGEEYYSTIYAVQESPLEAGAILVGANDGPVHVTRNGGATWTDVTPVDLPPGGRVQNVEWSPHRKGKAYIAVYRYLLGDWRPYIYRTVDYGKSWTRLTTGANGIPADDPTRVVREDPVRQGLLYAGTEFGLFLSTDDGGTWRPFQLNLPVTPVTDILIHRDDLVLSTMGRSFWSLDDLSPVRQAADAVPGAPAYLVRPRDAVRLRYAVASHEPGGAEYPTPGMYFDYFLPSAPLGEVVLEVLDARDKVIRRFSSEDQNESVRAGQGMRRPEIERYGTARIPKTAGHHRFRWGFSVAGPRQNGRGRGGSGPWVVPAAYRVRLTAGGSVITQPFRILPDPRLAASGVTAADLTQQYTLAIATRGLAEEVADLVTRVAEARKQSDNERLAALARRLTAEGGRYPTPRLAEQTMFLYSMTLIADQRMGRDVTERLAELRAEVAEASAEFKAAEAR